MKYVCVLIMFVLVGCGKDEHFHNEYKTIIKSDIETITICPEIERDFPEVLLRIDGFLYAVYHAKPNKTHLVQVIPGNYITTNGYSLTFSVTSELKVECTE